MSNQNTPAMVTLRSQHRANGGAQRLGQFFVNQYIKDDQVDERLRSIFYEPSDAVAAAHIALWLEQHHYVMSLPVQAQPA